MARRRRRRRHAVAANPVRRRRRRRAYASNPIRRHTTHRRRRSYRRNPFGLGKGRGLLGGLPDLTTVALAALGAAAVPILLAKTGLSAKHVDASGKPTLTGVVVRAAVGGILAGMVGKFVLPRHAKILALGATVVPVASYLMSTKAFGGLGAYDDFPHFSGAGYMEPSFEGIADEGYSGLGADEDMPFEIEG